MSNQSQNEFKPDWDGAAVMVDEMQRMGAEIETLKRCLFQAQEAAKQLSIELELSEKRLHEVAKLCAETESERDSLSKLVTSQGIRLMEYESQPELEQMAQKWCWWMESDEHFKVCESESEAHGEAQCHIDDNYETGDEVSYNIGRPCHPIDTIMHSSRLLWTGERIFEDVDQWCADETGAEDWTMDITNEDKEALGKLVLDFLRQHAKVMWLGLAKGHTQHTYTAGSDA